MQNSQEREFKLCQQLSYLRKDENKTTSEHICIFKGLCDSLATIGKSIPNKEKVFCLLMSLGPQYETFTTTMMKPPRLIFLELVSQLQNLDQRCNWFSNQADASLSKLSLHLAFYGQQSKQTTQCFPSNRNNFFNSSGHGFQAKQLWSSN